MSGQGESLSVIHQDYSLCHTLESVTLRAAVVLPILLPQKRQRASKTMEHVSRLERRLKAWKEGNLNDLDWRVELSILTSYSPITKEKLARSFCLLANTKLLWIYSVMIMGVSYISMIHQTPATQDHLQ